MKPIVYLTSVTLCCGAVWSSSALPGVSSFGAARVSAQTGRAAVADWLTDGGDNQRTGWQRNETILTKRNVKNLKILWKIQTGNQVRALHSLMPVLIIGRLSTSNGPREVGIVNGISDNLYAFDVESGTILWQKHWTYTQPAAGGGPPASANADPAHLGFLRPGGSSDTPVIGPPDAQGRRAVYFVTGDGILHTLNAADGADLEPPYMFHTGKGWSLNLVGNVLWMANTYAGITIAAVRVDDSRHKVMTFNAGSGGAWGRRGAASESDGTGLSTWEDSVGNRWILAPFWGPVHSKFKFEVTHGPVSAGGVGGFRLRDRSGKLDLTPVWVSADMKRGEPVVIANGMVFGYGSGEETKQSWPDIGLNFDSSIRAAKSTHAT